MTGESAGMDLTERPTRPNRLDQLGAGGRALLACYFALGDPLFDDAIRDIYAASGVDIIELGLPAADPYLDGPDVAGAMARSIASGADPYARMDGMVRWLGAQAERPAGVCMAYGDIDMTRIGAATRDGLDGLLIVGRNVRPDHRDIDRIAQVHGIRDCGLVPLGFSAQEADAACALDGYVMMQAAEGVTGPKDALDLRLGASIAQLKSAGVHRPILAGFGIGTAAQARAAIDLGADGVVIGSMCVRKVMQRPQAIAAFLAEIRAALDA